MGTTQALVTVSRPSHGPSISYFFPIRIGAAIRLTVIRFGCDASIPSEVVFHTCSVIHRMLLSHLSIVVAFADTRRFFLYQTMLFVTFRSAFNLL